MPPLKISRLSYKSQGGAEAEVDVRVAAAVVAVAAAAGGIETTDADVAASERV